MPAGRAVVTHIPRQRPVDPSIPERLVPLLCPGGTVAILASGPSLVRDDIDVVLSAGMTVIAINDALRLAPDAAVFYSGARAWWPRWTQPALWNDRHKLVESFPGLKVSLCIDQDKPGVLPDGTILLANTGNDGLELRPNGLRTYQNSGGAAINLAMHLGATRVLLLGYDMGPDASGRHHCHETHRTKHSSPYAMFRQLMQTMVLPLHAAGVEVVNCSRVSQLPCFPRKPLAEVLERQVVSSESA